MRTYLFLMLCLLPPLLAADEVKRVVVEGAKWPELVLRDGRVFKDVTFLKVRSEKIKFTHAGGVMEFEPRKLLPADAVYTVNLKDQRADEERRDLVREYEAQTEAEALEIQKRVGRELTVIKGAIRCRDWCLGNPNGGVFQAADGPHSFTKGQRDEQLRTAMELLTRR